jgi:hypothetical protein
MVERDATSASRLSASHPIDFDWCKERISKCVCLAMIRKSEGVGRLKMVRLAWDQRIWSLEHCDVERVTCRLHVPRGCNETRSLMDYDACICATRSCAVGRLPGRNTVMYALAVDSEAFAKWNPPTSTVPLTILVHGTEREEGSHPTTCSN